MSMYLVNVSCSCLISVPHVPVTYRRYMLMPHVPASCPCLMFKPHVQCLCPCSISMPHVSVQCPMLVFQSYILVPCSCPMFVYNASASLLMFNVQALCSGHMFVPHTPATYSRSIFTFHVQYTK